MLALPFANFPVQTWAHNKIAKNLYFLAFTCRFVIIINRLISIKLLVWQVILAQLMSAIILTIIIIVAIAPYDHGHISNTLR